VRYTADEVVIDLTVASPALLVLTDAWYPGWQVEVQSRDADSAVASIRKEVLRTDILFRGVAVEPGVWRVTYVYRAPLILAGAGLSFLGGIGLICYIRYKLQLRYCSKKDIIGS
jgi:hypothetical protein